ncbi:MAG: PIG-L family deacetylase [Bacteroidota bacterium]
MLHQQNFRLSIFLGLAMFLGNILSAQAPLPAKSSAEIQHELKKLNVLGSVLYVAAHPDDENTRLIAWLAGAKGYRTSYISLTRGDGGQNIIGDEKGSSLGVLRTQELLAARRVDGGEQMFSRAIDFGYSKNPEETLASWDKEKVLADLVWAIRKFQPDVIITRFATPEKGGGGHGHHTASAMLAHEAFSLANDPSAFPEQLQHVGVWQAKRLLWNNYWVFRRYQPTEEEQKGILTVNIGEYDPLLGRSYGEIASEARSMHKCQAFGANLFRGSLDEYLEHELGERADGDLFDGINTSWERVQGGKAVGKILQKVFDQFDPTNPAASVPDLLKSYQILDGLEGNWAAYQKRKLKEVILYCAGLWMEAYSDQPTVALGDSVSFQLDMLQRTQIPVFVEQVDFGKEGGVIKYDKQLATNSKVESIKFPTTTSGFPVSQQYWLTEAGQKGVFTVKDQELIGLPENPAALYATVSLKINDVPFAYTTPVVHKYRDRAVGELYRPFLVAPPVTVNMAEKVYLFADDTEQAVSLLVKSFADASKASVRFETPEGWSVTPARLEYDFTKPGEEKRVNVMVKPPSFASEGNIRAIVSVDGKEYDLAQQVVKYGHIPTQMIFPTAQARLVRVALEKKGQLIGYIMGSGDEVPVSLRAIGYSVELLEDGDISLDKLEKYDAIIAGIRAYNTRGRMAFHHDLLMEYVKRGGTYIVQYNTTYGLTLPQPGPYPIKISRDRITVEEAKMNFLAPDHPVLNTPNKLTDKDFDNWVQERGLYFPNQWDDQYTPIFSISDPGEEPLKGALLVAEHGKGHFVYTGLSFFRELPAGVSGAYRLFANLVSLGQEEKQTNSSPIIIDLENK